VAELAKAWKDGRGKTKLGNLTHLSAFLARVEIEQRQDNCQQNDLPKSKHTSVEAASLIVGVHVNYERPEGDAGSQPDDLSFCVPQNNLIFELRSLE
jgi:hypothetical protein